MRMGEISNSHAQELRIEATAPGALQSLPNLEQFDDSKHLGYALTWFGLAATLCVSFMIFGFSGRAGHWRVGAGVAMRTSQKACLEKDVHHCPSGRGIKYFWKHFDVWCG